MSVFSDMPGPQQASIQQLSEEFVLLTGWAPGLDVMDLNNYIAEHGLTSKPDEVFAALYKDKLADWAKPVVPWAEFGLTENDYHTKLSSLKSMYYDLTGSDMPGDISHKAFSEKWTAEQLQRFVSSDKSYVQNNPWAADGDTYTKARESYMTTYGQPPADVGTLRSWWNYRRQAKTIGPGREAVAAPSGGIGGRGGAQAIPDTEVR